MCGVSRHSKVSGTKLSTRVVKIVESKYYLLISSAKSKSVHPSIVRLAEMLSIYAKLHGNTLIPSTFIVPLNSSDWPSQFHGAKVGRSLVDVRSQYRNQKLSSKTISLLEENHILWESKSINAIS